ncbi:sensor histidine kinase, partial [Cellulomonas triticagri]
GALARARRRRALGERAPAAEPEWANGPADYLEGKTEFWRRSLIGWDVVFYVLLGISAASMVVVDDEPFPLSGATLTALAACAVLLGAYLLLGRRGALRGDVRMTRAYLVVLVAAVTIAGGVSSLGSIMLFIGFSQIWFFACDLREGIIASTLLAITVSTSMAVQFQSRGTDLLELAGQMAVGLAFALALGIWITRIAEQSENRAWLIDQVEAAQAQAAASNHAAGVLAERERVAQEIHDTLAQGFTSVVMLAQTAQAQLDAGAPEEVHCRLEQIERVARENLAEARALVAAFGPAALADATLAEALTRLGERFQAETGVRVDVTLDAVGPTDRDAEVVLLRAAQEALANVRKHAGARRVLLRLLREDGAVTLEVLDDGNGLAPGTAEGVGLRGMRERVAAGGGSLHVAGEPGRGTRVRLALPVPGGARTTDDERGTAAR